MNKISSGIGSLDNLVDSLHIGDNVIWEVDAGTAYDEFIKHFVKSSFEYSQKVIYVSFNRSPQSILNNLSGLLDPASFTLIDCFTSGKGKNDNTFVKFYETSQPCTVIRIRDPRNIEEFTGVLNTIEDSLPPGVRYVLDSLTGMQDLWGDEDTTYRFFTYMCPRLYDLDTVAYWILEKDAHSQKFKANLRHITQVVLDLSKRRDKLFIKALKLTGRTDREAFKPHSYEIQGSEIFITQQKKESSFDIGSRVRDARTRLGMSQKDLADRIGLTSSFISQIENNQISPSLNSFLQIAQALHIDPTALLKGEKQQDNLPWLMKSGATREHLIEKTPGYSLFRIASDENLAAHLAVVNAEATINRHFFQQKKDEFIYIAKGTISVTIDGAERDLRPGDAVYLKDSLPSGWGNTSEEEAELLVISV